MTTSKTALLHADTLAAYLKDRLPHRRTDALLRLAEVLLGILQAESALHRKIALHLPRSASLESKTRVVARVFHDLQLTSQDVLYRFRLIFAQRPPVEECLLCNTITLSFEQPTLFRNHLQKLFKRFEALVYDCLVCQLP